MHIHGPSRAAPIIALVIVVHATGCRGHVALEAPPADAPLEERVAAYHALKPRGAAAPVFHVGIGSETPVRLASGVAVSDPLDFAPVLDADAQTLQHAERARTLEGAALGLRTTGVALIAAGLAGMFYASATVDPELFGMIALASPLAALTLVVPGVALNGEAERERQAAFAAYPRDLRTRLALDDAAEPR